MYQSDETRLEIKIFVVDKSGDPLVNIEFLVVLARPIETSNNKNL